MAAEPASGQVLQNLEAEICLDATDEAEFSDRIAQRQPAASTADSWEAAIESVRQTPSLQRKRPQVPPDRLKRLTRITIPSKLLDMFPALDLRASGLTVGDRESPEVDLVERLVDEASGTSELRLAALVWVAEHSQDYETARAKPVDLADRLGLRDHHILLHSGHPCVEIQFDRADLPPEVALHVPSSLDGIDNDGFRPVRDCDAAHGMTEPLNPATGTGFPEAVHGPCTVSRFEVTVLKP